MNRIEENKSLKSLNTFGFDAKARYFAAPDSTDKIKELLTVFRKADIPVFILGGGSNVIFAGDFDGLVLRPQIKCMERIDEDNEHVVMKVGAGVVWDEFVRYAVENGLGGIENLSGIPGNVGASPVQNIGAYGMEAKDSTVAVSGIFIDSIEPFVMENADCKFMYRNSVFKNELKNKTVITHVTFRLSKNPVYKLDYGNLKQELGRHGETGLTNIRKSIISIRTSKLPDPVELGNAGSFYKNPVVEQTEADRLLALFPSMPVYPDTSTGKIKLSAGWLIEKCSLKGFRQKDIGVHHKQALVLVNYGKGTASELITFSQMVQDKVFEQFGIKIEPEVNIVYP
ncbi:MAG: UDP-N-acetylmuramate dehydrogenase [Prevotellaceae bacterium]|jgi:UDP-N-acetylmuramate dehydrogenase|nr:UDP-N-acetylmuramate dehydrogenase [Prevotellaceae bacterium]